MEHITKVFKEKNLKLTPQRIAVYKVLQNTTEHPSAETVYSKLQEDFPTMSLATVYKTLKTLTEVNLIQELNIGENNFRYDALTHPHPHIKCIKCFTVCDVENIDSNAINSIASENTDFKILSNQIYFYGLCPECK